MIGKIRPRFDCPNCGGKVYSGEPPKCSKCGHPPKRHYIDIHWRGKPYPIFSNRHGEVFSSYELAEAELIMVRSEIKQGIFDPARYKARKGSDFLFENFCQARLLVIRSLVQRGKLSAYYLSEIQSYADGYFKFLVGKDLREINKQVLEEFDAWLDFLGEKKKMNVFGVLHKLLVDAKESKLIHELPPFPKFDRQKARRREWPCLSMATQDALLQLVQDRPRDILTFYFEYGTRPAEPCALWLEDLDFESNTVTIRATMVKAPKDLDLSKINGAARIRDSRWWRIPWPKEKRPRTLPMSPLLRDILSRLYDQRKHLGLQTWVFVNDHGGPYMPQNVYRILRCAAHKIGVKISLKDAARHSLVWQKLAAGVPIQLISATLGHMSVQTTENFYALRDPRPLLPALRSVDPTQIREDSKAGVVIQFRPKLPAGPSHSASGPEMPPKPQETSTTGA